MDFQRLFLFLIFTFSLALVWDGWQRHQNPERYTEQAKTAEAAKATDPSVPTPKTKLAGSEAVPEAKTAVVGEVIKVKTDVLDVEINTLGGDITRLVLLKHPDAKDKTKPLAFFETGAGTHNYKAQSGLLGEGLPNHTSLFVADQKSYQLTDKADKVEIRLRAASESPLKVTKIITFHKNSYLIDIDYELENTGAEPVKASSYYQLIRNSQAPFGGSWFIPTYTGVAMFTEQEKYQKLDFADIANKEVEYPKQAQDGWIGIIQHYFVSAWVTEQKLGREYFAEKMEGDSYRAGVILPELVVKPGQTMTVGNKLYAGPAKNELDEITPGLGLSVDYGILTILSYPLFVAMEWFHDKTGNWGWAIVLLTVALKLVFFPLSAASYRSMAKMRVVAPKLERIKKQYGHDREKLGREMMNLYKTEKINPLGGCLPVLIQIPVFIALYWAILASVEMRYAPFFGWLDDLSATDPYFILPILMGISMVVQMRLNPPPPDPIQAKVMKIMPYIFSVAFFFFPVGLVLYSLVNNILSIAQQWYITRKIEAESKFASKN